MMKHTAMALAIILGVAGAARAAQQTLAGHLITVYNPSSTDPTRRKLSFSAKEKASVNTVEGDPRVIGATLEVVLYPLSPSSQQCFSLPGGNWVNVGDRGFRYKDILQTNGPIKVASIKKSRSGHFSLKAKGLGSLGGIAIVPQDPTTGADVFFTIAGGDQYCSSFTGGVIHNDELVYKARFGADPGTCPSVTLTCGSP